MYDSYAPQPRPRPRITRATPVVTYAYMAACVAMFGVEWLMGGSTKTRTLVLLGAKVSELIYIGQLWRLVTPMFLHIGVQHIVFNMFSLYIWGRQVELLLGRVRYALVLLAAGVGCVAMSYAFNTAAVSAGASGAIFGLFGALLMFRRHYRQIFDRAFGVQVLFIIGVNLVMGFLGGGVDNWGHIGGLSAGFLLAETLGLPRERRPAWQRVLAALFLLCFIGGMLLIGHARVTAMYA